MTATTDVRQLARATADQLNAVLDLIEAGEVEADVHQLVYLTGAVDALLTLWKTE